MSYGFSITDAGGNTFDDSTFTLLTLGEITLTGNKVSHVETIPLEMPPNYDVTIYPWVSYTPSDTKIPSWEDHVSWSHLSWVVSKNTTAPYSISVTFDLTYGTIGKRALDTCISHSAGINDFVSKCKTTFLLVASSTY